MGLREKVTITLVIITLIQIACRHCMPRTPRKASLKRYLNDLKPVKNNPAPTSYSPTRLNKAPKVTSLKTAHNGRIGQNSFPKKSLHQTYKFPEMEFPLDNSPRDPFHIGMNFNDNNHISTLQKASSLQSTAINDLKKEMKMKRKLLSNKQMNNDNSPLKTDMSSIKFTSNPDFMPLLDSESFPEVQYPLNTMETWGLNQWRFLPLTQEKHFNGFGEQTLNRQAKKDIKEPFKRLTKAKASKYLQSYDKLKEEQRRTSTENSKRSNAGQKGLNFTKTATCEKISDDFMTAGLVSNTPSNSTEIKRTLEPYTEIKPSSENTCPVAEYPNHYVPIPYRVIENNTENMCAFEKKNYTKELLDVDTSVIAQTLQLIEEILFHDDTSSTIPTGNYSKEIENNVDSTDSVQSDVPANEDIPTTLMDSAKIFTDCPAEEISQEDPNDAPSGILPDRMPSLPAETLTDNSTAVEDPLSVRMPLPFSEPIEFEAVTTASKLGLTKSNEAPIANSNAVPGSTSIIIIPINNNSDGKSLSHLLETTTGTPIIVYLPSTQNSVIPSQTQNEIVSSSLDDSVPNNELYNVLSNMAPLQNDNPSSTALVSELLNSISDSGSSLPVYETLPTNSMCYNNESTPLSMKEKPISDILIDKSLTDAPLSTTIYGEKLSQQPTKTDNFDMNTETLAPTPDFEHPLFDFAGSDFSSLNHGPYNNVLNNELPILASEINSDQQISNVASEDLFIPTQNVTSEYLHTNISNDDLVEITNDASTVAMDQSFSFETPTDSLPETIIIDEMPPTPLTATTVEKPLPIKTSLSLNPLSETLSGNSGSDKELNEANSDLKNMNMKLPPTPIRTTDNTFSRSPVDNDSPMKTDMSIKTELFKMRQILDKMLSSGIPPDSQTTPMDSILSQISETDSLPMLLNESLESSQTHTDSVSLPAVDKTVRPLPETHSPINSLGLQVRETHPSVTADRTSSNTLPLPVDISLIPRLHLDTADSPPLLIDETVPPTPVVENPADNKPYLIDNLVTPLSETRTKYTPKNDLARTTDDVPSKMDLVIPNRHELPSDELLLPVYDLTMVHEEKPVANPKSEDSTKNLPTQVVEHQNPHSEDSVSDLLYLTKKLSIPEALETTLNGISSESNPTTMSGFMNKKQQDFSPSIVNSSEDKKKQKVDLPLSITPDLSDDSPSPINAKIEDFAHIHAYTKDLLSVVDHLLLPEDDANPDTIVTHIPSAVPLSTNLDKTTEEVILYNLPHDYIIPTEDKMLPPTDYSLTDLPLSFNKTPTTSKLSIAKALLENVLSDITKGGLTPVIKTLSVTPPTQFDETIYHIDSESPVLEAKKPSLDTIFPKTEASTNLPNLGKPEDVLPLPEDKAPSVTPYLDIPTNDLPFKMDEISTDELDIQTNDIETQERTETLPLDNPADDFLLATKKVSLPLTLERHSISNKNILSASKLPITKTLLENVLSDITKGFSLPTASEVLPVKPSLVLDKTIYYLESPLPDINKECPSSVDEIISSTTIPPTFTTLSDQPSDINLPYSGQSKDNLVDKTLSEVSSLDIPSEKTTLMDKSNVDILSPISEIFLAETPTDLPIPNTEMISSSKLPITKALLEDVLSDVTSRSFSLPVSKILPVKSSSVLDKTIYYLESPLSDPTEGSLLPSVSEIISGTTHSDHLTDNNLATSGQSEDTLPLEVDKTISEVPNLDNPSKMSLLMNKSNTNILSTNSEFFSAELPTDLPIPNTKILSSSKFPITKALLENVLSDVTSRGFLLPVSKILPVKSSSVLDKSLDYLESPLSDPTEGSLLSSVSEIISGKTHSDHLTDNNLAFSGQSEDTLPLEVDKTISEVPNLDNPSKMLALMNKVNTNISSPFSDFFPAETPTDLPIPNTKILSLSKLPIAKALLQNVLQDVTSKSFSLPVSKILPVKSSSVLDKSLDYLESPLSDPTEGSLLPSVSEIISGTTHSNHLTDNNLALSGQSEDTLPLEVDKTLSDVSNLDNPSKMSSLMNNSNTNILSPNSEFFPAETPTDLPIPNTKILSSSKLPIAKALLQNVLQDVTSKSFSLPVSKILPVKSSSVLDKSLDYLESPLSDPTEGSLLSSVSEIISGTTHSENLTDNNLAFSGQSEDTLPMDVDKTFSEVSNLDNPSNMSSLMNKSNANISSPKAETFPKDASSDLPLLNTRTISSSKLPIAKALLQNVLQDVTSKSFSLPVSKILPVKSSSVLDKSFDYLESPLSDPTEESEIISSTTLSDQSTNNNLPFSEPSENILRLEKDKTLSELSSLEIPRKSNVDTTSSQAEILPKDKSNDPPLPNTKTLSSSKLLITKALLENVLSDINTKGFSLPVAKSLPVESRCQLDKTLYYMASPLSDWIEESSHSDLPSSEINDDIFELSLEYIYPDNPNLDVPIDDLPISYIDQISEDRTDNLTEEIEDEESNETLLDNLDDTDDLPT